MGLKTEGQRKLSGAPKSATTPKAPSALAKGPVLSTLANAVFGGLKSAKGLSHAFSPKRICKSILFHLELDSTESASA